MTRASKVPVCSLIDFYQCIPDYEDVMHLPSHELDARLRDLRSMQKIYLSDGRSTPLFTTDFRCDYRYLREDYRDFLFPGSEGCPRVCPYGTPTRSSSKYDSKLNGTIEGRHTTSRESKSTPFQKDSAVTTGTPSTLSNKNSAAFSNGDYDTPSKSTERKKNCGGKTERAHWSKPTTSYLYSSPLNQRGSPSFPEDYDCDDVYGTSWIESQPTKLVKGQISLPCSPVHRRSAESSKQRRTRLLSYLSTPDVRVAEEKPNYVFRAQPFPSHIFSNYLNKRREEKINNRAVSRKARAEELQKTPSLPPSMRRRQKGNANTKQPKTPDDSDRHRSSTTSPNRFRYAGLSPGLSPYRKVDRRTSGNKRRSRSTSVEARDNLASLLRLQASRRKLEAESAAAAELAAVHTERRMRTRAMRLSPVWHSALSRPTTAEELTLKAARRREETAERKRRRRRSVVAMRERVRAAPTLMERQSLVNRAASSLGGFSCRNKSAKHSERFRRSSNHIGYTRSQLSSYLSPKRRRSRVVISNKNFLSDDEVHTHCRQNTKPKKSRKPSFSYQRSLREVYYDPPVGDYSKQKSRPGSPTKSRSLFNHSPNYRSHVGDHSDYLSEEENLSTGRQSPSWNTSGGRVSRADQSFSDSHGEDSQIPHEHDQNNSSGLRNGQTSSSNERKHPEQSDEATYSKSVSHEEFGTVSVKTGSFCKSETWPTNSAKRLYENQRMEGITKKLDDISLRCTSPREETREETNFQEFSRNEQPYCRSTQSSPQLRRRSLYHEYKSMHESIPGLDLASQRDVF